MTPWSKYHPGIRDKGSRNTLANKEGSYMIKDLKGMMDSALSGETVTISVAAADENETLHAVAQASKMGLAKSIMVE
jgi:hypothetical protein